jgi:light-regulated signal transduction histidine kinase (bacteriophytochrome)
MPIQRTEVDLKAVVDRVVKDLDATKGDRRVIWLIGSLPSVQADPMLMQKVIKSLLANALNFTHTREVARIQVGAKDGDHEVIIFVRDNGTGVDLKHRERMFASFQHRKSSPAAEGGAVGLTHVQRIIQRHGGRMWTEAVPDGGAIFFFSLPNGATEPEIRPRFSAARFWMRRSSRGWRRHRRTACSRRPSRSGSSCWRTMNPTPS